MMTLSRLEVGADGTPAAPAARGFWSRVFAGNDLPDDAARQLRGIEEDPIDAAWLVETLGSVDARARADRLDQISFGQRVFGAADAAARADVFVAVRAVTRYRMLMWTLERIGIRAPSLYAAAARQAARIGAIDGRRGFEAQAQFQGALAILARAAMVTTLDAAKTRTLIEQLVALPLTEDGRYAGAVARWLRDEVAGAIQAGGDDRAGGARGDVGAAVRRRPDRPARHVGGAAVPPRSRRRRAAAAPHRPREAGRRAARCGARHGRRRARARRPTRSRSPTSR